MKATAKLKKIQYALDALGEHERCCRLCPRECGVNRKKGERGYCQAGNRASLSHALLHLGEEPILSGHQDCRIESRKDAKHGSGTIFFTGCHLKCVFCQNHQLSWQNKGTPIADEELAVLMLDLQARGALNINFVSPSHLLLPLLRALQIAFEQGLHLPLVYNCSGYEKAKIIRELDGIIDVYLPDFKYSSAEVSLKYSGVDDYFFHASAALREMVRQRPALIVNSQQAATEGVLIRHLVLPGQVEDSLAILEWIDDHISAKVGLSLMSQYQPCYKAPPELQRRISSAEYARVLAKAEELQSEMVFVQPGPLSPEDSLVPDFDKKSPFNWFE